MPVTLVSAEWVDGDLVVTNAAGDSYSVSDLITLLADIPTSNVASPLIWNDGGALTLGSA